MSCFRFSRLFILFAIIVATEYAGHPLLCTDRFVTLSGAEAFISRAILKVNPAAVKGVVDGGAIRASVEGSHDTRIATRIDH